MTGNGTYLELTGKFRTQVAEMDAEHQQLVDIINRMYEIYQQRGDDRELLTVLDDLLNYGIHHFADEEVYMARKGTPTLGRHQKIHQDLIRQVFEFRERLQSGQTEVGEETFKFLQNWLMGHIAGTDVKEYGAKEAYISEMNEEELQRLADSLNGRIM